jgi:hypothetical protein
MKRGGWFRRKGILEGIYKLKVGSMMCVGGDVSEGMIHKKAKGQRLTIDRGSFVFSCRR